MLPSEPPTPIGGAQSVNPSLLRTNSSLLTGAQAGSIPSQSPFSSLVSPRTQFNSNGLIGNMSNVSPLLNHSYANGAPPVGGVSSVNLQQRGGGVDMLGSGDADPLSFASSSGTGQGPQHFQNTMSNQLVGDHQQQLESVQNFQHQFAIPQSQQQQQLQQQQQFRGGLGGMGSISNLGPVNLEQQQMGPNDQNGPAQQLQALRGLGSMKMEPQQLQSIRSLGPVKMEPQHSDPSIFLQQQQQQQQQQQHQILQLSRQNSQTQAQAAAHMSLLQQQRMIQMQQQQHQQQQQQQQILKNIPQQRNQLQQQVQQQALGVRPPGKPNAYEPGTCAKRLTNYMYHQQHRPEDNNIEFWRKFVTEYFAPNAKKRWCVSLYGSSRQTTGVFPQDVWHCEICNRKPGRGFETTVEVLPRLLQIKYASGTLEELLYVDMPREYQNASGQIVLDYAKAVQESVFEQLRVVREGQLRIVFNSDLKISSWEFCAKRHEELIPRRLIVPQVSQFGAVAQKYQAAAQNSSTGLSTQDLQSSCNTFVASARQLAKAFEVPLVNDLGYTKRYVRCLQISEVVNCMKDLIDYSRETGTGPMESLINFPRRISSSSGLHAQSSQRPDEQQNIPQNSNHNDLNSNHAAGTQLTGSSNGGINPSNSLNNAASPAAAAAATSITGLLHQNSMNSRQETQMNMVNSPYSGGNTVHIPSASSSNSLAPNQPNISSPFPSPPSASNNIPTSSSHNANNLGSHNANQLSITSGLSAGQHQAAQMQEPDHMDSQGSVQQILQDLMSSQLNGVNSLGSEMRGINGMTPGLNGGNCLVGNGMSNSPAIGGMGFTGMGGLGPAASAGGLRGSVSNNAMNMNGRIGMNHIPQDPSAVSRQQQDITNRLLSGLGAVNNFNNMQFDWKPSP